MPVIVRYAAITLPPLALLILAGTAWGGFAWIALAWLTLVAALADKLLAPPVATPPLATDVEVDVLPWPETLSIGLGLGHLLVLISTCNALASADLTFGQSLALFLATASFFGQVSHPNAHELIHRKPALMRGLGAAVYTTLGFGHHVSAHRLVHHRHVGTEQDPSTPLPGESFWAYLPRAWRGTFEAGLVEEVDRLDRKGRGPNHITNPYWLWLGGALLTAIVITTSAGVCGLLVLIGLGALTGAQILMSDYVQHYGLQRLILPNGRLEPVAAHHSWNAPQGFSSYLMMNAPAHSEHHLHPDRPYDTLSPSAQVPLLPFSMPVMAMIATMPSAWHRLMDKRALTVMEAAQNAHLSPKSTAPSPAEATPSQTPKPAPDTAHDRTMSPRATPRTAPAHATGSDTRETGPESDPETDAMLQAIRAATR